MYKCARCGREFDNMPKGQVRCPFCAYRIVLKVRPPVTKKIKAR
ncbi:MAG: DNA-directed RNA polymerase subunit P [Candidatus Diapherotrites archaeon]|uniref:DNA-directed RNA polymerase subunit Rpo12 n=1 Tax=Candidatus Iainarchaeum sp. TaxID=3101447 RepID=A0A497JH64_9ARCH|nr:DNA-directed RNA polymerase subunit P [Candidatus Diapherotrites archaeon]RLG70487.1 MAG: DNA-directed RNA polymerase subunit P [Candidatus Diapherotrites archaeon]